MAKKRKKSLEIPTQPLYLSDFSIIVASPTDAKRYANIHTQIIYSHHPVKDKHNPKEVREVKRQNFNIHRSRTKNPSAEIFFFRFLPSTNKVFFLVKGDQDIGFAVVNFRQDSTAFIADFGVTDQLVGIGTIFYRKLEQQLKNMKIKKVEALVPFDGARIFWNKMGFTSNFFDENSFYKFI